MVVLRRTPYATRRVGDNAPYQSDFGGTKLSLLLEKQHNRGQDGAGAAILSDNPEPGTSPYWICKSASATALVDVLAAIARRKMERTSDFGRLTSVAGVSSSKSEVEKIFLGHLRYATFGKNETAFCHPFMHEASELSQTLFLAGNFNLTNTAELFADYSKCGAFPTSKADGYLICEMIAHELQGEGHQTSDIGLQGSTKVRCRKSESIAPPIATAISKALANADGAWTLCGMTGDGWAFATRDPNGIRPGFCYIDDDVAVIASERPAIQAAFDVPPEAVEELPPGKALIVSPAGEIAFYDLDVGHETRDERGNHGPRLSSGVSRPAMQRSCAFERIYFSRANDADIHRERKALGAALVPQILEAADAPLADIFFSYIPNSARIAFHGLMEELFRRLLFQFNARTSDVGLRTSAIEVLSPKSEVLQSFPRFGEIAVKDAKFRTFIADAAARREFYKHVYDVTYGLVRPGKDTLVVLDDSIVRGNTMKNAILPMLDRLGPKRIVIASSAPPIRYPDCYGIDMSTLGELVAFRALVNLLGGDAELLSLLGDSEVRSFGEFPKESQKLQNSKTFSSESHRPSNPLASLYNRFTDEQHCAEIARLLTPPGMKAEVKVVYQTVDNLRQCLQPPNQQTNKPSNHQTIKPTNHPIGDWYFTGDYPTPGGYKVLHKAIENYLKRKNERSY